MPLPSPFTMSRFEDDPLLKHRVIPRVEARRAVRLEDGTRGEALDFSAAGLRAAFDVAPRLLSTVRATIDDAPGEPVIVEAAVVWLEPPELPGGQVQAGLELLESTPEYLALVARLFAASG